MLLLLLTAAWLDSAAGGVSEKDFSEVLAISSSDGSCREEAWFVLGTGSERVKGGQLLESSLQAAAQEEIQFLFQMGQPLLLSMC
jgi:hypothetical protein